MKLFAKIFFCATLVISAAVLLSGYLLITDSYKNALLRETEHARNVYQYDKFTVQSAMLSGLSSELPSWKAIAETLSGQVAFFSNDQRLLYSNLPSSVNPLLPKDCTDETATHSFLQAQGHTYLSVCGKVTQGEHQIYMLIVSEISAVVEGRQQMIEGFGRVYFITLIVSAGVILILTTLLIRPIKRLTTVADRIAGGQYGERISTVGSDEIAMLSSSFNRMAQAVEDRMELLTQNARQKEDFVANFAHELKTPLTSVIGYADMLYQKTLSEEAVKDAAGYILSEGLRLEALSLKLMELIVLNRQDFVLEELSGADLLQHAATGIEALVHTHGIALHTSFSPAFVLAEFDLLETLLLNLLDNAVKSEPKDIWLTGDARGTQYVISVRDNGRGIPAHQLERITEAFYMVDKSRARTQHGAGLGLALSERIAILHGDSLHFTSTLGEGTTVSLALACLGGEHDV